MNKQAMAFALLLSSLCASQCMCQALRKMDYQALSCPSMEQVIDDIDLNGDGTCERIRIIQSLPSTITPRQYPKEFWEGDCYRITIEDFQVPLIYSEEFCTSYGKFTIYFLNLTGTPYLDVIFELYKNRGTDVTEKYFIIKHWNGQRLVEKAVIPGSMYIGYTPHGRAAFCERTLILARVGDKQYEASFLLNCEAMSSDGSLATIKPDTREEKEFMSQKKLRLTCSAQGEHFRLIASDP